MRSTRMGPSRAQAGKALASVISAILESGCSDAACASVPRLRPRVTAIKRRLRQEQFFVDVPCIPLGAYQEKTAYRGIAGMRIGFAQSYDVRPL